MNDSDVDSERTEPTHRRLQIYAFDPSMELDLETARINRSTIRVPWEKLAPGPTGAYLEVIDVDPPSNCVYAPVDLDRAELLANDGLPPSEGNPEFHQQMVYAVAMRTIENFERALGRTVHWSARLQDDAGNWLPAEQAYVAKLRIYPHALREANAYYSPDKKAVLFGYFNAQNNDARDGLPGGLIFSCLSHDIIAHEVTHAIVDGVHRRLLEASNPDTLAFHEAFGDLMAILQHFTLPGVLKSQIARTRGDLKTENLLAKLAVEFGYATNRGNALRDALGTIDPQTGIWKRQPPDPSLFCTTMEPHARGALFVAAIFDAFLTVYSSRSADLLRIATGGTGVLALGDLHPDLVNRLADEAARVAQDFMTICIRALDYLPPVDVNFGDYIRGLITSDVDLVPDDRRSYRIALIRAFRDRGVYPRDVRTLSVESLLWRRPTDDDQARLRQLLPPVDILRLMAYASDYASVAELSYETVSTRPSRPQLVDVRAMSERMIHEYRQVKPAKQRRIARADELGEPELLSAVENRRREEFMNERQFAAYIHEHLRAQADGINDPSERDAVTATLGVDIFAEDAKFEVHAVRPTIRKYADGRTNYELLVLITQRSRRTLSGSDRHADDVDHVEYKFRGGCTLLIDPVSGDVRYAITKNIRNDGRRNRQENFLRERLRLEGFDARARYGIVRSDEQKVRQEPFRLLHRGNQWEDRS